MKPSNPLYLIGLFEEMSCVEDLFGDYGDPATVEEEYRSLKQIHIKLAAEYESPEHRDIIKHIGKSLEKFYALAQKAIDDGTYGERKSIFVTLRHPQYGEFLIRRLVSSGSVCKTYYGFVDEPDQERSSPIIIRIASGATPEELRVNSRLLVDEAATLKALRRDSENSNLRYLPELLAQFTHKKATVNVLRYYIGLDGCHVRLSRHQKDGVEGRHLAWVMERTFTTLGYCDSRDVVHCNITPAHIVIDPHYHDVGIVSWQHSVATGSFYKALPDSPYLAPESKNPDMRALPSSDIYSLGKSLIYLAGGDPASNTIPVTLPPELAAVLRSMVLDSPPQRPYPHDLCKRVIEIRKAVFGGRDWAPLPI